MLHTSECSLQSHILGLFSRSSGNEGSASIDGSSSVESRYAALRERLLGALASRRGGRWADNWMGSEPEYMAPSFQDPSSPDLVPPALDLQDLNTYTEFLCKTVIPGSPDLASPLFMGHMTGPLPYFASLISELIVLLNQNLVKVEASPALTSLELETIASLHQLVYRQSPRYYRESLADAESSLGLVTLGGTLGNLTALWIARNLCFGPSRDFPGVEAAGVARALDHYGCGNAVIVGSKLMHYSIAKAASLLGFGSENARLLPVDSANRLDMVALQDCISDCAARNTRIVAVVGVAGTTECGSIDPLEEIAEIAAKHQIFFHVDGAWGGPLLFSARQRSRLAGIEKADSVVLDGHKQMYLPIAVSALLLRDPHAAKVIEKHSRYMLQEGSGDLGRRSLEGSRNGAALFFHAGLNLIGEQGYAFLVEENLRKAQIMADLIRSRPEFEILVAPETSILLFRGLPAALRHRKGHSFSVAENADINCFNERLQKRQSRERRTFVSRTTLDLLPIDVPSIAARIPLVALRAVITNPLLEEHHMHTVLDDLAHIMVSLENEKEENQKEENEQRKETAIYAQSIESHNGSTAAMGRSGA
ncbi:MAG TPA: aminotransferase class V-fold PLP-dependent enzyme [Candidatus Angelobacter sp.]|nr:aminotransferase class V-fold PLP-dependent enzyme [Candidatus Angelobacter sp.]